MLKLVQAAVALVEVVVEVRWPRRRRRRIVALGPNAGVGYW